MRYTLEQLLAMQSPEKAWEGAGWSPLGWTTDDGQMMYSDPSGERQVTQSQLMSMVENGDFTSGRNLLPEDIVPFNLQDTAQDWSWINNQYGTNFQSGQDYLNYLYGGAGTPIYDQSSSTDYYVLPEGMTGANYVNSPLQYNPPDKGLDKWMPYLIAGGALAGLGGFLPGTESVFGGGAAAGAPTFTGGASGAGIAGAAGGGGALSGMTAAEVAALGGGAGGLAGASGGGLSGMGGTEFAGGASGGGLAGGGTAAGEFVGGASGAGVSGGATGGALSGAGGAAVGGAASGATSALGRILGGTATSDDWLSVLGAGGSSLLGVLGSNAQADAYGDVAQQYLGLGAPFREKLLQSYAPGFSMADQPDFQNAMDVSAQAAARATSAKAGNPVDNPGAYAEMQKYITGSLALPQLNTYRSQLGSFGQLGTNTAGTASMGEASQTGGMYDALGSGLASLTKPKNPYEDLMKGLMGGFKLNTGTSW